MKQLKILNENYYNVLLVAFSLLICYNIYALINSQNLIGILPILIQSILLYLLITKNAITQKAIKYWVIFFFFCAQGFRIIGIAMQSLGKYMENEDNALEMLTSNKMIYAFQKGTQISCSKRLC